MDDTIVASLFQSEVGEQGLFRLVAAEALAALALPITRRGRIVRPGAQPPD